MSTTTAFIGGGQMAQALIAGILEAGILSTHSIIVAEPDHARRQFLADAYGNRLPPIRGHGCAGVDPHNDRGKTADHHIGA
jgi:pyrroline-5-carboxylate reductase